jgi:pimeloyl-ACP methyl ester carboxylesterase
MVASSERRPDRKAAPAAGSLAAGEVRVRRAYFESRYGQLHVHHVMPAGGGFDEATTVLCIPGAPGSGRAFYSLLPLLGRDRSVYAPDLPGAGESDAGPPGAGAIELANGLADFLDSMRFRRVNIIAHGGGGPVAAALIEARRALVGKLVLSASGTVATPPGLAVLQLELGLGSETGAGFVAESAVQRLKDFLGMN